MKSCRRDLDFCFAEYIAARQEFSCFSSSASFSLIFFLIFSVAKHPSEDENLEDGWLDRFSH